jgi:FKBP-type peptidyl-prolyl cis-trans isomerase
MSCTGASDWLSCLLQAAPKYAFGDKGREGCPSGSAVELELELQQVKTVKAIDPDHKGHVMKTILKDGAAYHTPNDMSEICVSWTGKLTDGTVFDKVWHVHLQA